MHKYLRYGLLTLLVLAAAERGLAQNLAEFENKVTEFTLENGLHFIVIERHTAPIASFVTYAGVGSADEPMGQSGIAHIFEHMVFKGSRTVGTTNYAAEAPLLDKIDEAYIAWRDAKRAGASEEELEKLRATFKDLQEQAKQYVVNNQFSRILDEAGAQGLNAFTASDETAYFYSLPSNKAELFFFLESDRFKNPVLREFYVEKDVVYEERRMRTESNPIGRLIEEFLAVAFTSHSYGIAGIGWPSDIETVTRRDAEEFFARYYVPENFTVAIAGDVDPANIRRLAEQYFGDIPYKKAATPPLTEEIPQRGERRFVMEDASQPIYLEGYKAVSIHHPDFVALNLLSDILSSGRTSRLYKRMVDQDKVALQAGAFVGFPGDRYPGLMLMFCVPNQGVDLKTIEQVFREEIAKVQAGEITQEELDRAITKRRADLVRELDSNEGLALQFATSHKKQGDWRKVFTVLDDYSRVTLQDLQRVANTYLVKQSRTIGMIQNKAN